MCGARVRRDRFPHAPNLQRSRRALTQRLRTVLIAADFAEGSREAFHLACSLAGKDAARLVVLHVVEPSARVDPPLVLGQFGVSVPLGDEGRLQHESRQARLREAYVPRGAVEATYHTSVGNPAEEVLRMSDEVEADSVGLGTHGRTGLRRPLAGSVAEVVLRRSRRPVLALRSAGVPRDGEETGAILHPTDFSAASEVTLRVARSIARERGLRLVVLSVIAPPVAIEGTVVADDPQTARESLEAIRAQYDGSDLKVPAGLPPRRSSGWPIRSAAA